MHQHVAGGDDAQPRELGGAHDAVEQVVVAGAVQQLDGDGRALGLEPGLQPHGVGEDLFERLPGRRDEQREAFGQAGEHGRVRHLAFDIARMREVAALLGTPPRDRDPVREVAVAAPRLRQQHEARMRRAAVGHDQPHLAADDEMQLLRLGLDMGAHDAGERALVGEGERAVAERSGALDQLFGVRGARQEAEVAAAVKLGVRRKHGAMTVMAAAVVVTR